MSCILFSFLSDTSVGHILRFFCNLCRTHLALSDISSVFGHFGRTYLAADTSVTHLDETSHMSAEFVFRYGPKCMGGLILPILVLLHL